jgi:hypothetical protein
MLIKAIAGHADESVTDRYVHVSIAAMREAVIRLEQAMLATEETAAPLAAEVG